MILQDQIIKKSSLGTQNWDPMMARKVMAAALSADAPVAMTNVPPIDMHSPNL